MTTRHILIDTGEAQNARFTIETDGSPMEILDRAMRIGFITVPAGAARQQGAHESRTEEERIYPFARIVAVS